VFLIRLLERVGILLDNSFFVLTNDFGLEIVWQNAEGNKSEECVSSASSLEPPSACIRNCQWFIQRDAATFNSKIRTRECSCLSVFYIVNYRAVFFPTVFAFHYLFCKKLSSASVEASKILSSLSNVSVSSFSAKSSDCANWSSLNTVKPSPPWSLVASGTSLNPSGA